MKLLVLMLLVFAQFSFAQEEITCSDDVVAQVELTNTCDQAAAVAETCAFGSSRDVPMVAAAISKCEEEYGGLSKLSSADKKLLDSMNKRCNQAWGNRIGTMYLSARMFCLLDASKFMNSIMLSSEM